jgi:hypothetical protein
LGIFNDENGPPKSITGEIHPVPLKPLIFFGKFALKIIVPGGAVNDKRRVLSMRGEWVE